MRSWRSPRWLPASRHSTLDGLGPICHGSCSREERVEEASVPVFGAILGALAAGVAA